MSILWKEDKGGGMMERLTNTGSNGEIWITDNDETRRFGRKESAYKKLAEYEDLEEQGLLLRLPCHIGDIIYEPTNRNTINEYRVTGIKEEAFALWIEWKLEKGFVYQSIYGVEVGEIGKTVFLTQAEAEQKLKEMESD